MVRSKVVQPRLLLASDIEWLACIHRQRESSERRRYSPMHQTCEFWSTSPHDRPAAGGSRPTALTILWFVALFSKFPLQFGLLCHP
jgi:hypothetical protein